MPFAPIWEAHKITVYFVQVFHVSWKNSLALWLQLLLSSSVRAEFQKGLCLVSSERKKNVPCSYWKLSSFPNSFCVKQKMCLSSRGGSSYSMLWLQQESAVEFSLSGIQTEHPFTWVTCPWKGRITEENHVPYVCAPCLGMHTSKALKEQSLSELQSAFLSWNVSCFYVLAVPLYLNTTKPLGGGYLIRKKKLHLQIWFLFKISF